MTVRGYPHHPDDRPKAADAASCVGTAIPIWWPQRSGIGSWFPARASDADAAATTKREVAVREGHVLEAMAVLAAGSLVLIGWILAAQPEGSWVALAAGIQALATVLLVVVAISLTGLVEEQAEASRENVDRLVRRDRERQLRSLRAVHTAMTSLADEARRWDVRDDILRLARQGMLPDDHLEPANLPDIKDGAASLGSETYETVWRAIKSAREARHSLDVLRRRGGHATGQDTQEEIERLERSLSDLREKARLGAASAREEAAELEERIERDGGPTA